MKGFPSKGWLEPYFAQNFSDRFFHKNPGIHWLKPPLRRGAPAPIAIKVPKGWRRGELNPYFLQSKCVVFGPDIQFLYNDRPEIPGKAAAVLRSGVVILLTIKNTLLARTKSF